MSLHAEIKQLFVKAKYSVDKVAVLTDIQDNYTIKVRYNGDWFSVTAAYKQYAEFGLLNVDTSESLETPSISICQGLSSDPLYLIDLILPALFEFYYKPIKNLVYSTTVKDYTEFASLIAAISEQATQFESVVVDCLYSDYYHYQFEADNNRLSFFYNDSLVASANLTGEPEFYCHAATNATDFINAVFQLHKLSATPNVGQTQENVGQTQENVGQTQENVGQASRNSLANVLD